MSVRFLYTTLPGRLLLKGFLNPKVLSFCAAFLRSPSSKAFIGPYIRHNRIDMRDFPNQEYDSFADFFSRKKAWIPRNSAENELIAPCDSRLSIFPVEEDTVFCVKGSQYRIGDLIRNRKIAEKFAGGLCLIYRLEASDYHHFCYIDDCYHGAGHMIQGTLHSVQPIACERVPVYHRNRRMWSLMKTKHFGPVAQIEVGALLVGGMVHTGENCSAKRGDEMGYFELAGSTIIQFFTAKTRKALELRQRCREASLNKTEVRVRQGQVVGVLR